MINSIDFAKFMLKTASSLNITLNQTKLQKMIYICDGTLLAYGRNAINENAQAWDHGPVYPKVYKWYSKHISEDHSAYETAAEINADPFIEQVVRQALVKFKNHTGVSLSEWSHKENSPWDITVRSSGLYSKISKNYMKLYFAGWLGV